jgi:hypothetical protein
MTISRIRAWVCGAVVGLVSLMQCSADPILPYSLPIATQLSNDLAAAPGDKTLNSALNAYHRPSRNVFSDVSILRNLNDLLADVSGYSGLLSDATGNYINDVDARIAGLQSAVLPTPRSSYRSNSFVQLRAASNALNEARSAATTTDAIASLQDAARRVTSASNSVVHALAAKVKYSSMYAKIGKLHLSPSRGETTGFFQDGVLNVVGHDLAQSITRSILIHLEGVSMETPATYELGTGANKAFYYGTDIRRQTEVQDFTFEAQPSAEGRPSTVTIDAITPRFIIGRFQFTGLLTQTNAVIPSDTNLITTITNGEFQVNF